MSARKKNDKVSVFDPAAQKKQEKVDAITRRVAIAVVFVGVFYFFIKLLFL